MKPRHQKLTDKCQSVSEILARVGDKWTVLVVSLLGGGPLRFSELRRAIDGISQKMLTTTLRILERDGFCTRKVFPTVPPRVEYELTALGRDLLVPVKALGNGGASTCVTPSIWAPRQAGRVLLPDHEEPSRKRKCSLNRTLTSPAEAQTRMSASG